MADLGSIGSTGGQTRHYVIALDTAWARSISANLPTCFSRSAADSFFSARYRDQWREIRGTVKNSSGVGIARRVLAIDNRTGHKKGETTSAADGTFKLQLANTIEAVTVIAVPLAGDSRNAVVFDNVTPVVAV